MKAIEKPLAGQPRNIRILVAALLTAVALAGCITAAAATFEGSSRFEAMRNGDAKELSLDEIKSSLTGSYVVTGTDPDGRPYANAGIVDIALAPSGALELEWDNGRQVGIGQLIGDVLAVACLTKGRTAILLMNINPDGSLSGKWSRRTDRGYKGTETWKKG